MSANVSASTQQVSEWLSNFGTNLDRADFDAAMQMFCGRQLLARLGVSYLEYQNA